MTQMISQKLFRGTQIQAREEIQKNVLTEWYCIVSFLYFAQAMKFDLYKNSLQKLSTDDPKKQIIQQNYKQALLNADLVFIDGIAMQLFDRSGQFFFSPYKRSRTQNLNGTDFLPFILNQTKDKKVGIILSSVYDTTINKWPEWMEKGLQELKRQYPHIDILFTYQTVFQERGQNFPFWELTTILDQQKENYDHILFLNGIGGPVQEIRTEQYRDFFKNSWVIVLNNGATIDYYSWFETRAPQRVVKMRVGETLRRIVTQPKKNLHKFLAMFRIIGYRRYLITNWKKNKKSSWNIELKS